MEDASEKNNKTILKQQKTKTISFFLQSNWGFPPWGFRSIYRYFLLCISFPVFLSFIKPLVFPFPSISTTISILSRCLLMFVCIILDWLTDLLILYLRTTHHLCPYCDSDLFLLRIFFHCSIPDKHPSIHFYYNHYNFNNVAYCHYFSLKCYYF